MMNWFLRYVLGGKSKSTEFALLVFLIYCSGAASVFGTSAFMWWSGVDHDFSLAVQFLTDSLWPVLTLCGLAFGLKLTGSFGAFGKQRQDEFGGGL